jgi:hypothetical protein
LYREALRTERFSILRNDFLSQIIAQLELTDLNLRAQKKAPVCGGCFLAKINWFKLF